jgi:hypothetical protein
MHHLPFRASQFQISTTRPIKPPISPSIGIPDFENIIKGLESGTMGILCGDVSSSWTRQRNRRHLRLLLSIEAFQAAMNDKDNDMQL